MTSYTSAFPALHSIPVPPAFYSIAKKVYHKDSPSNWPSSSLSTNPIYQSLAPPKYPKYLKQTSYANLVYEQYEHSNQPKGRSSASSSTAEWDDLELRLPTAWNWKDKAKHVEVDSHGLQLKYAGPGKTEAHAGSIRSNFPMPPQCGIFYFEMQVISKGDDGYIGIGFCTKDNDLERLPGWDTNSFGYHGDDGHGFAGSGVGKTYGPSFTTGDVIGCGVNFSDATAFYTKNGMLIGTAFSSIDLTKKYYPVIGLRTPGEHVATNFGDEDFMFDIELYIKEKAGLFWKDILQQEESQQNTLSETKDDMETLVMSYLLHHGYTSTANALVHDHTTLASSNPVHSEPDISQRQGDDMMFQLQCGQFIEIMREYMAYRKQQQRSSEHSEVTITTTLEDEDTIMDDNSDNISSHSPLVDTLTATNDNSSRRNDGVSLLKSAMALGQQLQEEYRLDKRSSTKERLTEIFSLLAYPDVENSPAAPLLDLTCRDQLATRLNSVILGKPSHFFKKKKIIIIITLFTLLIASQSQSTVSSLEHLYRQAIAVNAYLALEGNGEAILLKMDSLDKMSQL
ncbi:concanavalin A-like lectin/glucanase domain-containing protein [Halteromyces radiatus]|uniref:concanavalin A-like lectin/glucanase domain-containing protein n=1 Tax=Halteromyces radiatus TaxID=101107 RepID=UPI002221252E|nr:concanavalin A-like lectin/glucanase domain-containing protein [Halteromyces radiatus]KAI8086032.1 concanavalin A-like lectin/glucanase domain-containing protein [Halteromyces radiatus]